MQEIVIDIAEQIIIVVIMCLLAGLIIGWLSVRAYYKAKYDVAQVDEFFRRRPLYDWQTSIPCPGSFLLCVIENSRMVYGYAISFHGEVAILKLPGRVDFSKPNLESNLTIMRFDDIVKWSYAEDHPIWEVETLRTYEQRYKSAES